MGYHSISSHSLHKDTQMFMHCTHNVITPEFVAHLGKNDGPYSVCSWFLSRVYLTA